jgi:hypothetical protein
MVTWVAEKKKKKSKNMRLINLYTDVSGQILGTFSKGKKLRFEIIFKYNFHLILVFN